VPAKINLGAGAGDEIRYQHLRCFAQGGFPALTASDSTSRPISTLSADDLAKHPVWQYSHDDDQGELSVRPVGRLPVSSLSGKVVGTKVRLSSGAEIWALIGSIDSRNKRLNQHYLTISVEHDGHWFHLARYHDHDYVTRGPDQLARFLGRAVDDVFPLTYDVRPFAVGDADALAGVITKEPLERLSRAQIIALAVP